MPSIYAFNVILHLELLYFLKLPDTCIGAFETPLILGFSLWDAITNPLFFLEKENSRILK